MKTILRIFVSHPEFPVQKFTSRLVSVDFTRLDGTAIMGTIKTGTLLGIDHWNIASTGARIRRRGA